jgi:hypothetical protein
LQVSSVREGTEDLKALDWAAKTLLDAMAAEDTAAAIAEECGGDEEADGGAPYSRMILGGFGQVRPRCH